ncbi:MAG TPA: ABC transporter permease [Thermoplasmata archaeon]|nr:ABC transporter permease [Thermoplasmata archaeon]
MSGVRRWSALTKRELLKIARNPPAIVTSLLLPILYLVLFGQGFSGFTSSLNTLPPSLRTQALNQLILGAPDYYSYFAAGMVGFVGVTATLFVGANVIFDKLFGTLKRAAATPATATDIFGARLVAGSIQPVGLAFLVLGLALLLGHLGLSGLNLTASVTVVGAAEVVVAILVLSLMFASLFLSLGFTIDQPQTYFAVVNAINLPVLLTSAALYPWGAMPSWLQSVASYNPVTLAVEVLRINFFGDTFYPHPAWYYLLGLVGWAVVMFALATFLVSRALAPRK